MTLKIGLPCILINIPLNKSHTHKHTQHEHITLKNIFFPQHPACIMFGKFMQSYSIYPTAVVSCRPKLLIFKIENREEAAAAPSC